MIEDCREIIRRHSSPLSPIPTGQEPLLRKLGPLEAVLFDVYGTLLISGSGDIGACALDGRGEALAEALAAAAAPLRGPADAALAAFDQQIEREHREALARGVDFPEVDIVEVWENALAVFAARGWIAAGAGVDPHTVAVEFEVRTNPIWPMPGLLPALEGLLRGGKTLGLVSNAQFYTPQAFCALLGRSVEQLGFPADLQFYSYEYCRAKPSAELYRLAAAALQRRGIPAGRALYVGNDMRNDIAPAARLGFRTALFAGDARSLRRRAGDPLCADAAADLVVTDLRDLLDCV